MSEIPTTPSTDSSSLPYSYNPALGFTGVLIGILILLVTFWLEGYLLRDTPGQYLAYVEEGDPIWEDTVRIAVRRVPMAAFPKLADILEQMRDSAGAAQTEEFNANIRALGIERTETIICLEAETEVLGGLLESGRLPESGKAELLAGVYTRLDSFLLDGQMFTVVGRIKRSTAGLYFSYVLPREASNDTSFFENAVGSKGWLDFDAREGLLNLDAEALGQDIVVGTIPSKSIFVFSSMLGLIVISVFGMMAHLSVFRVLLARRCGPLRPVLGMLIEFPKTVIGMHALLYGVFFGMMTVSYSQPVMQIWMTRMIRSAFAEGSLSYVQDAFESGNLMVATWAIFWNNYVIQTVLLTVVLSLLLPLAGILKTALSFSMVGFGMVPNWVGTSGVYSFHAITMTLELEAYIIACVVVFSFWRRFLIGLAQGKFPYQFKRGVAELASGIILTGVMLGFAAFYEAVTLLLARG